MGSNEENPIYIRNVNRKLLKGIVILRAWSERSSPLQAQFAVKKNFRQASQHNLILFSIVNWSLCRP